MANNFSSTTTLGAAVRMRSMNCRSVAASAASGMLFTRPMLMQFAARNSAWDSDGPESRKSGIGAVLRARLLGRNQSRAGRLRRRQRLIKVGDDIVDVLDTDGKPDHLR